MWMQQLKSICNWIQFILADEHLKNKCGIFDQWKPDNTVT
jgi:hypothetical protein